MKFCCIFDEDCLIEKLHISNFKNDGNDDDDYVDNNDVNSNDNNNDDNKNCINNNDDIDYNN